jgi:hypothetical protein
MKVVIEVDSQQEFDDKREALAKAIGGSAQPREPRIEAQHEMLEYWMERYRQHMEKLKDEINAILK